MNPTITGFVFGGLLLCFVGRLIADILAIRDRNKAEQQDPPVGSEAL
jgi:hypothetical protein